MARAPGSTAGRAASAHKCISERPSPPLQQALTERAVLCYIKAERSGRAAACRKRGWMKMFRGARRADLDAILKIYARARQAMADSGNPTQWGDHFPPQELLEEDIDSNRLFLYLVNGELEGVFAFILGPDPTYARIEDGKWLNDTLPYGTIHRLASAGRRCRRCDHLVSGALREPAGRHPRRQQDHAAPAGRKRLYQMRHHPCGGWHAPHCLPENVPYPAFAPGLNRKNAPPHRKRWSGAVFISVCQELSLWESCRAKRN
jgi:hypothetical protein